MIANRIIDNAAVAVAVGSVGRRPVTNARAQALAHRTGPGATVIGAPLRDTASPEWAAWANGVAVRELDFHDTFLAADYSHPGDTIPALVAVARHCGNDGADLVASNATAYETQVNLVRSVCLHKHRIAPGPHRHGPAPCSEDRRPDSDRLGRHPHEPSHALGHRDRSRRPGEAGAGRVTGDP